MTEYIGINKMNDQMRKLYSDLDALSASTKAELEQAITGITFSVSIGEDPVIINSSSELTYDQRQLMNLIMAQYGIIMVDD
jgi:hypothetical protein